LAAAEVRALDQIFLGHVVSLPQPPNRFSDGQLFHVSSMEKERPPLTKSCHFEKEFVQWYKSFGGTPPQSIDEQGFTYTVKRVELG
jgi:hypothetical protein